MNRAVLAQRTLAHILLNSTGGTGTLMNDRLSVIRPASQSSA